VRVGLVSGGVEIAGTLQPASRVLEASETELLLALSDPGEVPDLVAELARGGARITRVIPQTADIEEVFLRLCREGA
jgi:hypothetical protein